MRDQSDIIAALFAELMEDVEIAPSGCVLDNDGDEVASYPGGMPGVLRFTLPKGWNRFTVHTPSGDVTEDISEALGAV